MDSKISMRFFFVIFASLLLTSFAQAQMPTFFFRKAAAPEVSPTGLSLTHSTRNRTFTVSWTAGSGNGGAGGCRLQYYKDGSTWTNITGTFNCDATTTNSAASFPTTGGWTNNFNGTGVQVRLQRISDSSVVGTFSQRATCTSTTASATSTPDIDEDCDASWNNTYTPQSSTNISSTFGAAYNCPSPQVVYDATVGGNVSVNLTSISFVSMSVPTMTYSNATCSAGGTMHFGRNFFNTMNYPPSSGTVPSVTDNSPAIDLTSTACQQDVVFAGYSKIQTAQTAWNTTAACAYEGSTHYR